MHECNHHNHKNHPIILISAIFLIGFLLVYLADRKPSAQLPTKSVAPISSHE